MERVTRRGFLAGGVGGLAATAGCLGSRGSPAETVTELRAYDVSRGTRLWSKRRGPASHFTANVTADGERVYMSTENGVYALSGGDGTVEWSISPDEYVPPPRVTDVGLLLPLDDGLAVLDPATGDRRGEFDAAGVGSVHVDGGAIYLHRIDDERNEARVRAVDLGNRSTIWETALDVPDGLATVSNRYGFQTPSLATSGDHVFVTHVTRLLGLDRVTGERLWSFGENHRLSSPVANGDTAIVSESAGETRSGLYALAGPDGSREWTALAGRRARTAPVLADAVYVPASGMGLVAVDPGTGGIQWTNDGGFDNLRPMYVDGTLVSAVTNYAANAVPFGLGGDPGFVVGVDAETGDETWSAGVETPFLRSGAVAGGTAYVVVQVPVEES